MGLECVPVPLFSGWTSCRKISRSLEAAITRLGGAIFGTMTSYHSVNKGPGTIWFMHDSEIGAYDRNNKPYVNIVLLYAGLCIHLLPKADDISCKRHTDVTNWAKRTLHFLMSPSYHRLWAGVKKLSIAFVNQVFIQVITNRVLIHDNLMFKLPCKFRGSHHIILKCHQSNEYLKNASPLYMYIPLQTCIHRQYNISVNTSEG